MGSLHHQKLRQTASKTFSILAWNHICPKYLAPPFPNKDTSFSCVKASLKYINFLVLLSENKRMHIERFSDKQKNIFTRDSLSQVLMFNNFPKELVQGVNNGMDFQGSGYVFCQKCLCFSLCI